MKTVLKLTVFLIASLISSSYEVKDIPPFVFSDANWYEEFLCEVNGRRYALAYEDGGHQSVVLFDDEHVIVDNPALLKDKKYTTYTKQKRSIADKNIYLLKSEQTPSFDEASEISAVNPVAKVTIIEDYTQLEKIIRRKEPNAMFLHVVGWTDAEMVQSGEMIPGRCYKVLMDVEGNLYYFAFHKMKGDASEELNGMQASDWKALATYSK